MPIKEAPTDQGPSDGGLVGDGGPAQYETSDEFDDVVVLVGIGRRVSQMQLNPCAEAFVPERFSVGISPETGQPTYDRTHAPSQSNNRQHFQVGIPTFSNGLTTFAYQQVLRNRIPASKLHKHAEYDVETYTPTFIHDCLMLPGSLANLLGKESSSDIISRMTPALLPGYRALADSQTGQPYLVSSDNCTDYVQGMLVFGQGKKSRHRLHKHYRLHGRRTKVDVETDVISSLPNADYRETEAENCRLERRRLKAHAWVKRPGPGSTREKAWTLEDYLQSLNDENEEGLRIDPSVYGIEEDGGVSLPPFLVDEEVSDPPGREVVMAGWGTIQYDRVEEGWAGW